MLRVHIKEKLTFIKKIDRFVSVGVIVVTQNFYSYLDKDNKITKYEPVVYKANYFLYFL